MGKFAFGITAHEIRDTNTLAYIKKLIMKECWPLVLTIFLQELFKYDMWNSSLKILVKVAILLTCFAVVFAEETTTSKATTKTPKKTTSTTTAAPVNKNQNNNNQETTTSKSTTKPTKKTTATTTSASVNSTCGNCLKVTTRDNDCVWNPEEESKTDFHYDKIGNCPCPDDPTKDRCNVVQRRVRNMPALQAWSACLFLLSICIAGKIHSIVRYYLYHYYPRKSPFVTHRKIFILAHPWCY